MNWTTPPPSDDDKNESQVIFADVRINLYDVSAVDTVSGQFQAKIGVFCYWTDPRLKGWPKDKDLPPDLWGPRFRLVNGAGDVSETNVEFALVDHETGRLKRCRIYAGTMNCTQKDLINFPFDMGIFEIKFCTISDYMTFDDSKSGTLLRGKSYRIREITEEGEGNWLGMVWDGMVQEWTLHGVSTRLYEAPAHPTAGYEQSFLNIRVHCSRKSGFYFWKSLVPLWFLVLLTTALFDFDTADISSRYATVSTYFLACFALLFVVADALPKLDFLTKIDQSIVVTISTFLVVGGSCRFTYHTQKAGNTELAELIDTYVEYGMLLFVVASNIAILLPVIIRRKRKIAAILRYRQKDTDFKMVYNSKTSKKMNASRKRQVLSK